MFLRVNWLMALCSRLSQGGDETPRRGGVEVHILGDEQPIRFAAEELARYLPRLLPGAESEVYVGAPGPALAAAGLSQVDPIGEQTLLVRGDGRRYAVVGGSPTAVLHAVYAFLESLGARWVRPGFEGESLPVLDGPPPPVSLLSTPAFRWRGLADGCLSWWPGTASFQSWLKEMTEVVDWMGKMRMNRLFVHFNRLPPGDLSPLLPELERRGIALELGGHSLPKLLPPGMREAEPEVCRMVDGVRRPDGNFCTSNPRTLGLLSEGTRRLAELLPPADLYHLWPYDAKEDPWCCCPDCRSLSTGRQMWRAVMAAAEGLWAARPGARISGLLYHESLGAVDSAPQGLQLLFAPRERCYLHAIEGECPRNQGYWRELADAVVQRGSDISVLEYYGDPILFGRPANRPHLAGADLAAYRAAGVESVSTLVFGALSWWLYPLQLYGYARASWNPAEAAVAAGEYCRAVGGDGRGEALVGYYRLEGEAAGTHLRFCGYGLDGAWATLPFPPAYPTEEVREQLAAMRLGKDRLQEAGRLLAEAGLRNGHLGAALSAHRLEESFHEAVLAQMDRSLDGSGYDPGDAFLRAVRAMGEAPPEALGVFGRHWMLPWLRRCRELGCEAPL